MASYVAKVLDALGIRFGPSHTEVMVTPAGEVLLIETAARMMGALDVSMITEAFGYNPLQLTAEAYLAEDRFLDRLKAPLPTRRRHACMVQMLSSSRGTLRGFDLAKLTGLPSFHGADLFLHAGEPLVPTIDSYTSPGLIFLSHADPNAIDLDYQTLRELERAQALYLTE
jgi:L-amino acid ligase